MYCVKCGVKLKDGLSVCPLCHTKMIFEEQQNSYEATYSDRYPAQSSSGRILLGLILSILYGIALGTIGIICLKTKGHDTWALYTISSIILSYMILVFPLWFKRYSPYISISVNHVCVSVFLGFICFAAKGYWFFNFGLPIVIASLAIHMTFYVLFRYLPKGFFYIFGSLFITLGVFCMFVETLQHLSFNTPIMRWSIFVFIPSALIGLFFIIVGISKPLQLALKKRFFI